jgi:hypothetical protein
MARIEDLKKRKDQLEARIQLMEAKASTKARKQRTRVLIELGGLVELAGLHEFDASQVLTAKQRVRVLIVLGGLVELAGLREFDRGTLLGALLFVRHAVLQDATRRRRWQDDGQALLMARAEERARRKGKETGVLDEVVGLDEAEKSTLLGALLSLRQILQQEPNRVRGWKVNGQAILDARNAERKQRKEKKG